jgi:hypothetical protein
VKLPAKRKIVHPSEKTKTEIVIDNPMAKDQIDTEGYKPKTEDKMDEFEKSLPSNVVKKKLIKPK